MTCACVQRHVIVMYHAAFARALTGALTGVLTRRAWLAGWPVHVYLGQGEGVAQVQQAVHVGVGEVAKELGPGGLALCCGFGGRAPSGRRISRVRTTEGIEIGKGAAVW